jgi:hypothetical protein
MYRVGKRTKGKTVFLSPTFPHVLTGHGTIAAFTSFRQALSPNYEGKGTWLADSSNNNPSIECVAYGSTIAVDQVARITIVSSFDFEAGFPES